MAGENGNNGFTKLLVQSEETDGSTTFVNRALGGAGQTITRNKSYIHHSDEFAKYGTTSLNSYDSGSDVDECLIVPFDETLNPWANPFCISFWYKLRAAPTKNITFLLLNHSTAGYCIWVRLNFSDLRFRFDYRTSTGGTNFKGTVITPDTNWHEVMVGRNLISVFFAHDGIVTTSGLTAPLYAADEDMLIMGDGVGNEFIGCMEEIRMIIQPGMGTPAEQTVPWTDETLTYGIDEYVKLLVQSDTTDGDTDFIDNSPEGQEITRNYTDAQHSTSPPASIFGKSFMDLASTTVTNYLSVTADPTLELGNVFCVETFFAMETVGDCHILSNWGGSGYTWYIRYNSGDIEAGCYIDGTWRFLSSTETCLAGMMYHVALTRDITTHQLHLYFNWAEVSFVSLIGLDDDLVEGATVPVILGGYSSSLHSAYVYLEETRISIGDDRGGDSGTFLDAQNGPFRSSNAGTYNLPSITYQGRELSGITGQFDLSSISYEATAVLGCIGQVRIPSLFIEGYTGAQGHISIPALIVDAEATVSTLARGTVVLGPVEMLGYTGARADVEFPSISIGATGKISLNANGEIIFKPIQAEGTGTNPIVSNGAYNFKGLRVEGYASAQEYTRADFVLRNIRTQGNAINTAAINGGINLPVIRVKGLAESLSFSPAGDYQLPTIQISGLVSGDINMILKHVRGKVN